MDACRTHSERDMLVDLILVNLALSVYSVVLDPSRNQVCSSSMDTTVRMWNLLTGQCQHMLSGHTSIVDLLGLFPSYLVSAAADSTLRIWDLIQAIAEYINCTCASSMTRSK